jgi:hypothetical protein
MSAWHQNSSIHLFLSTSPRRALARKTTYMYTYDAVLSRTWNMRAAHNFVCGASEMCLALSLRFCSTPLSRPPWHGRYSSRREYGQCDPIEDTEENFIVLDMAIWAPVSLKSVDMPLVCLGSLAFLFLPYFFREHSSARWARHTDDGCLPSTSSEAWRIS